MQRGVDRTAAGEGAQEECGEARAPAASRRCAQSPRRSARPRRSNFSLSGSVHW